MKKISLLYVTILFLSTMNVLGNIFITTNHPDVKAYLSYPNYRGITNDLTKDWKVNFEFSPSFEVQPLRYSYIIRDVNGKPIRGGSGNMSIDNKAKTALSIIADVDWPKGSYTWDITLNNNSIERAFNFTINIVEEMPKVYIDDEGFTVVKGKRFFPYGVYTGNPSWWAQDDGSAKSGNDDLERMSNAGFNTVLSYQYGWNTNNKGREFMDNAKTNNLMVVYSFSTFLNSLQQKKLDYDFIKSYADELKDHDCLLAWYINDEREYYEVLDSLYSIVAKRDGEHPALQVTYKPHILDNYYASTDILGTDPYVIGNTNETLDRVTRWTDTTVMSARGTKGVWQVLQMHNLGYFKNAPSHTILVDKDPTLDEMRNMTYQALAGGTKGLFYFAYHWLFYDEDETGKRSLNNTKFEKRWKSIEKLNQEIIPLTEIILKNNVVELQSLKKGSAVLRAWEEDNIIYLIVANKSESESTTLEVKIPGNRKIVKDQTNGLNPIILGNVLSLDLQPVESGLIKLSKKQ